MSLFSTKEEYESMVKNMEQKGFKVLTKFRKGIKTVRVADIPLSRGITESKKTRSAETPDAKLTPKEDLSNE